MYHHTSITSRVNVRALPTSSSWHGSGARFLKLVVSMLCLGGLARSRRCLLRSGALRTAASSVECWLPPPIVPAAVLQHAQEPGRLHQAGGPPAGPGTVEPLPHASDVATAKYALAPGPELCATAIVGRATKVSELKHRLTARRSLGGLVAERAAVRSGEKCWQEEKRSRRKKRKRDDGDSSSVTSVTEEARVFFFRRWQPHSDHS